MSDPLPRSLHIGCGGNYIPAHWNVDADRGVEADEYVDLEETPWPWPDGSFDYVLAEHVIEHLADIEAALRECSRVLSDGGRLEVAVPMGENAYADPDHSWGGGQRWSWDTPLYYCGERPWDADVNLEVASRSVDLHTHKSGTAAILDRLKWAWWKALYGSGPWCFGLESMTGEFKVVFRA